MTLSLIGHRFLISLILAEYDTDEIFLGLVFVKYIQSVDHCQRIIVLCPLGVVLMTGGLPHPIESCSDILFQKVTTFFIKEVKKKCRFCI